MSRQQQNADTSKTIESNTTERLRFAEEAEIKLRSRQKIREEDRAVMARNLGKMVAAVKESAEKNGDSFPLAKLFAEAFGEKSGESLYKKRPRLIYLPSDAKPSDEYTVYGNHYLDILKTLTRYIDLPEGLSEAKKYSVAVSHLIEGTSYDYIGGYSDRAKIEYRREIDTQLGKIVGKVLEGADLDWMRQWTNDHPVDIKGLTGAMEGLSHCSEYHPDPCGTLAVHGPLENRLAPCTRIASIFSDYKVSEYLNIEIKKNASKVTVEEIQKAVSQLVGEANLQELEGDLIDEKIEALKRHSNWQKSPGKQNFRGLKIVALIDIEIRYDEEMANWRPVVLLRWPGRDAYSSSSSMMYSNSGAEVIELFWYEDAEVAIFAVEDLVTDDTVSYNIFEAELWPHHIFFYSRPVLGQDDECGFYPPQSEFYDFLLEQIPRSAYDDYEVRLEIDGRKSIYHEDSYQAGFVKAPTNTLAYWILNNLAYAPLEERIDQLLLKDAREKYRKIENFASQCERNYQEAISRI